MSKSQLNTGSTFFHYTKEKILQTHKGHLLNKQINEALDPAPSPQCGPSGKESRALLAQRIKRAKGTPGAGSML